MPNSAITINRFQKLLGDILQKHKHSPYKRGDEGLVYVGTPEIIKFNEISEKQQFVYLLCMFIASDLKIYDVYKAYYYNFKIQFYIPKFEYGLTNHFIYPERIFNQYQIGINKINFEISFNIFTESLIKILSKSGFENINFPALLNYILVDNDLNRGLFGSHFAKRIDNYLNN